MKRVGRILLVIVCVIGVAVGGVRLVMNRQVKEMDEQLDAVAIVALDRVADGTYEGTAETPLVKVTVEVSVQDHAIREIELLRHENGQGAPAEAMLPEMPCRTTPSGKSSCSATKTGRVPRRRPCSRRC